MLEGVEGSGKSTQARRLVDSLRKSGYNAILTHEPGATALGAAIRQLLLEGDAALSPTAELFLYLADRAQHVIEVIKPALDQGVIVVSDRFSPSTIAYQGAGRGLGHTLISNLCSMAADGVLPDLVLILDVPPTEALRRIGRATDRIEREPMEFHSRVRESYLEQARLDPERFVVIDGSLSPEEVEGAVRHVVEERLGIFIGAAGHAL